MADVKPAKPLSITSLGNVLVMLDVNDKLWQRVRPDGKNKCVWIPLEAEEEEEAPQP